jgi:dipeptidyl aminopeptidase/acylaminoacyl peptidase
MSQLRAAAIVVFTLAAQAQTFTIEQMLGSAFPEELSAAPSGSRIAWIARWHGPRNIWVAEGPLFEGRQLTNFQADDGRDLSELAWSADGKQLFYVRGGAENLAGESPNPTSDPKGATQEIWAIDFSGGEPRKLGEGHSPLASPRGDRVVWIKGGAIWSLELKPDPKAEALTKLRGKATDLAFSPDGSKLAFTSDRGDHSFVGVYSFEAAGVRWLDPGTALDGMPVWSPDGAKVAFLRTPSVSHQQVFQPIRSGPPWSIRATDLASGQTREVFRAAAGKGSVFQALESPASVFWMANGDLVFPWERTGWRLLYAVPSTGGEARLLTPGEFEVEQASLLPGRTALLVSSNQGDIDRRHLWRVTLDGKAPSPVTQGEGIEWAPSALADASGIALLRSDAATPAHVSVLTSAGKELKPAPGSIPSDFPSSALVKPQAVKITAADGMVVPGQLFLPPGHKPGQRYPAVVFFHGGSRRQMMLGWHPMSYYHNAYAFNQYLASRGYVVLSVNYRSGIGYGLDFREAVNYGPTGASEFNDVIGAGLYLRSRPDVDPKRIGLWGGSYGGYLTAMGLARGSDLFAAGVDLHGVHDWNMGIEIFVPDYKDWRTPEAAKLAYDSSPVASLGTWKSPVLLIHGDDDRNVNFTQTVMLAEELKKRNVVVEELIFPDEIHGFLLQGSWIKAYTAAADFLDRQLKQ